MFGPMLRRVPSVRARPAQRLELEPFASFASGSNRPGQILAFADLGLDVGVAVPELNETALRFLESARVGRSRSKVFVDSGAFSEVEFGPGGPRVVKPLSAEDFDRILGVYERLAPALGSRLYVVAPDMVGHQAETLERLARHRDRVVGLLDAGVNVLVAMQRGELSQAAFAAEVDRVLGRSNYLPALPAAKAATSPAELEAFLAERRPEAVHLLGLGPRARGVNRYLGAAKRAGVAVSLDAAYIPAQVGRGNGRASDPEEIPGGPRRGTRAREQAKHALGRNADPIRVDHLAVFIMTGAHAGAVPTL